MGAQYSNLIFQPPSPPSYDENFPGLVWIKQEGLKLASLFLELETKDGSTAKYTLLYIPGNTEDLGRTKSWLQTLQLTLKVNIITFDYPGFGLSEGEPSEKNIYQSSLTVYKYLVNSKNVDPSCIIIMGKNLGTSGALNIFHELNHKKRVTIAAGLFLLSTFTSLMAISNSKLKFGKVDMFENIKKVDKVFCPTLVVHGQKDEIIESKLAKKLASKISTTWKFLELEDVGSVGIEYESDFLDTAIEFVDELRKLNDPNYHKPSFATQVPAMYRLSPINQWLQDLHLEQYIEHFLSSGYFNMEHISSLDKLDLIGIGIENEDHINTILDAIPGRSGDREAKPAVLEFVPSEKEYSEVDVMGPCEEDSLGFWKLLQQHGILSSSIDDIPVQWKKSVAFSSSIRIPYCEDPNDKLITKDFFGETYDSTWNGTEVIKHKLNHKKSYFKSFCKDVIILCQLKHPNVINTIGACFDPQQPYCIIREKLPNGSLYTYLQNNSDIPPSFRVKLALDIANGLSFLHTRIPPVIHKDLTTKNILLTAENTAKLSEFGFGVPPTFAFIAPEIFQRKPASLHSDIYSLGLVFYEIITGITPFSGCNGAEIATKISKEGYRPAIPNDTPPAWVNLIHQCWDKDPEARPSIEEVLEILVDIAKADIMGYDSSEFTVIPPQKLYDTSFLNGDLVDVDLRPAEKKNSNSSASGNSNSSPNNIPPHPGAVLLYDLKTMVNQEKYSDITIEVGAEKVKFFAHKVILAARSPQFEALIDQAESNIISLPHTKASVMQYILEFIYTSRLSSLPENIFDLILSSHELGLFQIVDICKEYIEDNGVPIPNCGEIKLDVNANIISPQNKKRLELVRESIFNVENGIKNIEDTLNNLHFKLESASVRKRRK